MRKFDTYRTCALRFKRWSRSAYASFCSIGREVSIGQLSVEIAECAMRKSEGILLDIQQIILSYEEEKEEEVLEILELAPALAVEIPVHKITEDKCFTRHSLCNF